MAEKASSAQRFCLADTFRPSREQSGVKRSPSDWISLLRFLPITGLQAV